MTTDYTYDYNPKSTITGYTFRVNPEYIWECRINSGFVLQFTELMPVPNRFHRWMQKILFGFIWRKL